MTGSSTPLCELRGVQLRFPKPKGQPLGKGNAH